MNERIKNKKGYSTLTIVLAAGIVVALIAGYFLGGLGKVPESDYKSLQQQYQNLTASVQSQKIRAAFIYVGPIEDYGWTHAHDVARRYAENMFPWLETFPVESVSAADAPAVIDELVTQKKVNVVFTTSFDFMDPTVEEAKKYPNVLFFHCSGYKRAPNLGTYFAELYQLYYLNGLMAGALTKTNKIGYVGAYPTSEVIRHINAFALGVKAVNPNAKVYVRWLMAWYNPNGAKQAAQALVSEGVDAIAYTEDSPTIIEFAEGQYKTTGKLIYVFSHYSPMYDYGPDVVVSGELVNWGVIYADILTKIKEGIYNSTNLENVDYWWMLKEGAVELGAKFGMPINPKFSDDLKSKFVQDPILGNISVYDLVFTRLKQMSEENVPFDPFTGPIRAQNGTVMIPEGVRADHDTLWNIKWFVDNVVGSPTPSG